MYPVLFSLGPIQLYSYGALVTIGLVSGILLLNFLAKNRGLKMAFIYDYLIYYILVVLLFSRLTHIVFKWNWYANNWKEIFYIFDGGFSFWGGVVGGLLFFYYLCLKHRQNELVWLDNIIIALQPMIFFGFLGFFLSPEGLTARSLGIETALPWGIHVDVMGSPFSSAIKIHPLALYFSFSALVTFIITLLIRKYTLRPGLEFFSGVLIFSFTAFIVESLKWQKQYLLFDSSLAQICSTIFFLIAVFGFLYIYWKGRKYAAKKQAQS